MSGGEYQQEESLNWPASHTAGSVAGGPRIQQYGCEYYCLKDILSAIRRNVNTLALSHDISWQPVTGISFIFMRVLWLNFALMIMIPLILDGYYSWVVIITCFNIHKLRIKSYYIPDKHWLTGLCNGNEACFVWGRKWILKCYLNEPEAWKG
jgi:hypothetical protein